MRNSVTDSQADRESGETLGKNLPQYKEMVAALFAGEVITLHPGIRAGTLRSYFCRQQKELISLGFASHKVLRIIDKMAYLTEDDTKTERAGKYDQLLTYLTKDSANFVLQESNPWISISTIRQYLSEQGYRLTMTRTPAGNTQLAARAKSAPAFQLILPTPEDSS